ncbi:hypothetical protein D3C84_307180 [compost metagenome]
MRLADVLGPDVGRQAILGVVGQLQGFGLILEWNQAHHRAKDFFLGNAHLVVHIGEHRRLDELALGEVRRQVGRTLQAASEEGGALFDTDLDVAGDLVVMGLGDHRADLGFRILRVANDQAFGASGKFGDELRINAFLDEDPATGGAAFAVQREDGEQRRVQRAFQVRVFENQHRRLAAQLHGVLFQACGLHDLFAGSGAAGERNRTYIGVPNQRMPRCGAITLNDVEDTVGNARFDGQATQFIGGQWRQFRHFQHSGIAQCQARRGLPGRRHERHVPWRYQAANTHWLIEGVVEHLVIDRVAVPVHARADFGKEIEVMRSARNQYIFGLVNRQAGIEGFQFGQVRHILLDQLAKLAHQAGTFLGGRAGPFWKRFLGRRYSLSDFLGTAARHFTDSLTGGRVVVDEHVFAFDLTAVDPIFDHGAQASFRAEKNSASLTIRLTRRPTSSTSTITSSPGTTSARPSGVPVAIMSPGCRVMKLDRYSIK